MNALNKQVAQHLHVTAQHIAVSKQLRNEMLKTKPLYNKASIEEQLATRIKFAELIGKENGIKPIMTNRGDVGFNRKTKLGDSARKMLSYYFPAKPKPATPAKKKISKQVDRVEQALTLVESLTKAEQDKFFKRVSRK